MDKLQSFLNQMEPNLQNIILFLGKNGFNLLFIMTIGGCLLLLLKNMKRYRRTSELFNTKKVDLKDKTERKQIQLSYFKKLRRKIDLYFAFKDNKKRANTFYVGILVLELVMFVGFILANKLLLAIMFPLAIHWFALTAFELMTDTIHDFIQKELPIAIKHMIKIMTKTNDLKTIMYEMSGNLREPLRSRFFELARRMITENNERALMEFAEELDNTWIYAYVFLLLSYGEQSKKNDIIKNLSMLADMLQTENDQREKSITEKKSAVILNYALVSAAIAAFAGNLFINKFALDFFMNSTGGMFVLIIGSMSVLGTFILNLVLSRRTF